jgi:hypothetical protein
MSMTIIASFYLAISLTAQARAGGQNAAVAGAERLKFMQDSVRTYELTKSGASQGPLKLDDKPVFRLGKQYAEDIVDGAIFLWTGEHDRPEAAVQAFLIKNKKEPQGLWIHEFTSLATSALKAERKGRLWWSPTKPGLEYKPVPGAPEPAESPVQRLRQMRSLADGFRASDDFGGRGWTELRMLTTPICRYGKPGTGTVDGTLFSFVQGTDPEVFLFLEARPGKQGLEWQYALAPMTVFAVKGSYKGTAVWELPNRFPAYDPSKPFFDKSYEP